MSAPAPCPVAARPDPGGLRDNRTVDDERPSEETEELRREQAARERDERRQAEDDETEAGTHQHERRADKAEYLKRKLEERAESERDA